MVYGESVNLDVEPVDELAQLRADVARLQASLDRLHGAVFSDRVYHALKARAETAERERDALRGRLAAIAVMTRPIEST